MKFEIVKLEFVVKHEFQKLEFFEKYTPKNFENFSMILEFHKLEYYGKLDFTKNTSTIKKFLKFFKNSQVP